MYVTTDYAQSLRAIGQALEVLRIEAFELEPDGDNYFVRGVKSIGSSIAADQPMTVDKLRSLWESIAGHKIASEKTPPSEAANETSPIELSYTPEDIARLDNDGRAKRGDATQMADSARLSQLLRCIGAYLTQKVARLVRVTSNGEVITIEYETSLGSRTQETLTPSLLYDFGVRMYLQRSNRTPQ